MSDKLLVQKLEQLYAALAEMKVTDKLGSMKPATEAVDGKLKESWDFSKIETPAVAANRASSLISSIACLKDHLKVWRKRSGKSDLGAGDRLIDGNRDVAIVHDLWNLDKHAELNRPSRSGLDPRFLEPPHTILEQQISTPEETVVFVFSLGLNGGQIHPVPESSARITATVVDRDGNLLGDLETICLKAVAAWEAEFVQAGLKLTPPPERLRTN